MDNLSDALRKLWLVNLYSRRVNVGTAPKLGNLVPEEPEPFPLPTDPVCGGDSGLECPSSFGRTSP